MMTQSSPSRLIKKYPNRRLYDTQTSTYITLSEVKDLVLRQTSFSVVDAKTGEDITRSILLQIIVEEESRKQPLLSTALMSQLICCYGNTMQDVMGAYLEKNVQAFVEIQQRLSEPSSEPVIATESREFSPEMWTQFMSVQSPIIQGMLSNYIEQSKTLFLQTQEQMQEQAKTTIDSFPFAQEESS